MEKETLILVVDDAEINLKIAEKIISREYSVECVSSGEDCIAYLVDKIPDLILLDLHMPGMDGFEVMEKLKSSLSWSEIPVIFLTADNEHDAEVQGFEIGAMDFITKPFVAEVMLKRVGRVLELSRLQKNLKQEVDKQTAVAEERRQKVENMSLRMIHALATTLDAKDAYTNGHASRVAKYSKMLAKEAGLSDDDIEDIYNAAILHDIGKIGVPDRVLNKPGRLNDEEYDIIKSHTTIGADILENAAILDMADLVAKHHHERYDGKGYPDGLVGKDIPLAARIVGVADAFDAMNSKRVYRHALPKAVIREELVRGRGVQFDPELDDIFIKILDRGDLDEIAEENSKIDTTSSVVIESYSEPEYSRATILARGEGEREISETMTQHKGSLIMFDLDNLKQINEDMGHTVGDKAIEITCDILSLYNKGIACRYGGDEFVLFVPEANKEDGIVCAKEIFDEFKSRISGMPELNGLSLSAGLCLSTREDSFEEVYAMADKALYYVKQNGKNGFYFYDTTYSFEKNHNDIELSLLMNKFKKIKSGEICEKNDGRDSNRFLSKIISDQNRLRRDFGFIMITLEFGPGETHYVEELEAAMDGIEYATVQLLGDDGECYRYSNIQYLVVCRDVESETIYTIAEKIFADFYKHCSETRLQPSYSVELVPFI